MRIPAAFFVILCFLGGFLVTEAEAEDDSVAHGTINVVLGNENGIVVLTDSMITLGDGHQSSVPAQKLFKLDNRTVCTFAGFAFAPGDGDFFYTSTSAIIQEFTRQLSNQPVSLVEKIRALSYVFARQLTVLANLRDATKQVTDPAKYSVQLTVVGYDTDGSPKIAQVTLRNTASLPHVGGVPDDQWMEFPDEPEVTKIGKTLVPKLAGIRYIADAILDHPRVLVGEPAIRKYADAKDKDDGQSLTIAEMQELAVQLASQTASREPAVGGPDQIAILQKGGIARIDQAAFPAASQPLLDFTLMNSSDYSLDEDVTFDVIYPLVTTRLDISTLFVKCQFTRVAVRVDNNYFSGDTFNYSIVLYDGSETMHFGKNDVKNSILIVGPHAKRESPRVKHLIHDFPWQDVLYQ